MTSAGMVVPLAAGIVSSGVDLLPEHGKRSPLRALDALQLASAQTVEGELSPKVGDRDRRMRWGSLIVGAQIHEMEPNSVARLE
jgi:hypothetical protein